MDIYTAPPSVAARNISHYCSILGKPIVYPCVYAAVQQHTELNWPPHAFDLETIHVIGPILSKLPQFS